MQKLLKILELEDIAARWQVAQDTLIFGSLSCYILLTLIIVAMIAILLRQGSFKNLPTFIKLALPAYLAYTVFAGCVFIYLNSESLRAQLNAA